MRCRGRPAPAGGFRSTILLLLVALFSSGCGHTDEDVSISPLPAAAGRVDPGLGPDTRPLSSGPGDKGSPSWSPGGDRIAFTVDGYVVDKPPEAGDVRRWTTRDFVAEDVEWVSREDLTVFGTAPGSVPPSANHEGPRSVYRAHAGKDSFGLEKLATGVLALSPISAAQERLVLALGNGPYESQLVLTRGSGEVETVYARAVEGRVSAVSPSPDGSKLVLAVRPPGDRETSELRVFDLGSGNHRSVMRLEGDTEILGTPQWTDDGLYFVAGEDLSGDTAAPYDLYRVPAEPGPPEPAPGVGEDFVAASIRVSPEGGRLAVIGRLNPKSPANLYVLDPPAGHLRALTTNEDMEIKTGPDDLAWSPDGGSVAIVARGVPSTEPEVHAAPAGELLNAFYNLYEIPVGGFRGPPR
jgi:TolB protein